jgi:hypothetical protein
VVGILKALNLPGIQQRVLRELLEETAAGDYPAIFVTAQGKPVSIANLTTASRVIGYPVKLRVVDQQEAPGESKIPDWYGWEDAVIDAFPDRKIPNYPAGVFGCTIMNATGVNVVGSAMQLADNEFVLMFRAVRVV